MTADQHLDALQTATQRLITATRKVTRAAEAYARSKEEQRQAQVDHDAALGRVRGDGETPTA